MTGRLLYNKGKQGKGGMVMSAAAVPSQGFEGSSLWYRRKCRYFFAVFPGERRREDERKRHDHWTGAHSGRPHPGGAQDVGAGPAAHVRHVWGHGAGSHSGAELRPAPEHPDHLVLCRLWHPVFPSVHEAGDSGLPGIILCLSGRVFRHGEFRHRQVRCHGPPARSSSTPAAALWWRGCSM